jgi:hypothetical protein
MKEIPLQQMNNVSSSSSSKPHLSGISLIEYNCRKKKRRWSKCVSEHYEKKFLPGKSLEPEEDCDDFFDAYRTCYMKGLLKERQRKGLPPPKEGTLLHEFMEEEGLTKAPNDNNNNNISMEHDKR